MILVYGTETSPKRAIPKGIPKLPVLPTSDAAKKIERSFLSFKTGFE